MNKHQYLSSPLFVISVFILIMSLSLIYIDKKPFEHSIEVLVSKDLLGEKEIQMVLGKHSSFLFFNFVNIELKTTIKNKLCIVKSKLIRYPFQKQYVVKSFYANEVTGL